MITKKLKKQWIKALKSGKYHQTCGGLKDTHGFCCLGVLCDVVDDTKWKGVDKFSYHHYNRAISFLPQNIKLPMKQQKALSLMNDDQGFDFDAIAQWIEENVETID